MQIDVSDICGEDIISRAAGRKIRDLLVENWGESTITLLFSGRRVGSVSFFDEAIGLLIKREGKSVEEIRSKLRFPDLLEEDRMLLNRTVTTRIEEARISSV